MPLTKVDDTERKRQGRAASPSERGRRSERAPRSKSRDADRKRQERAPSRTSSADATSQTSSKKACAPCSKARNAERMREERAPSPTSSADATGQASPSQAPCTPALAHTSFLDTDLTRNTRAPHFTRSTGFCAIWDCISSSSSFKQEGTSPRTHPPLRSLVCCIDNSTGARSAAKMPTACL